MHAAKSIDPVLVDDQGRVIATVVRGDDGAWWATLAGRVPTTLGPSRSLPRLLAAARQTFRRLNDPGDSKSR